jgi:acetyl-CoA carboxylase carboxyl transferase subunit alpha
MNPNYLDFEQPIADLEAKIHELRQASNGPAVNIDAEINALQDKLRKRTAHIFRDLSPWQVSQLARHPMRPYTLDYIKAFCDEFEELAGDRAYADDPAIVGGLGRIDGRAVVIIGHQKGRDTKSKVRRNFGMPRPEGYRKALRLMKMAELRTPIVCTVIGEGGSGGALAIGVGDRTVMLEYSTYSVISPEGCASILWKDAGKARDAAEQLGLTARRLRELKLVDKVVREPIGGAHRNPRQTAIRLKTVLMNELDALEQLPVEALLQRRYERLRGYGAYENA